MSAWTRHSWRRLALALAVLSAVIVVASIGLALFADLSIPAVKNAVLAGGFATIIAAATGYCCVELGREQPVSQSSDV